MAIIKTEVTFEIEGPKSENTIRVYDLLIERMNRADEEIKDLKRVIFDAEGSVCEMINDNNMSHRCLQNLHELRVKLHEALNDKALSGEREGS